MSKTRKTTGRRQSGAASKQAKATLPAMSEQGEGTEREYSSAEIMAAINEGNKAITSRIEDLNLTLKTLQHKTTLIEKKQEDMEGGLNRLDGDMDNLSRRLA